MAYLGKTPSQAVRSRYYFTASGGETSLSPSEVTGLSFTDANYVDVSLNGVALVSGTDYTATPSTNTISSLSALTASDVVEIVVYDTFSVFGGSVNGDFTISNGTLAAEAVTVTGLTTTGNIDLADSTGVSTGRVKFGNGDDLQMYFDGTNSVISSENTTDMYVQANNIYLRSSIPGAENGIVIAGDGAVTAYYDNAAKLATTSTGVDVSSTDATVNFVSSRGVGATHTITTGGTNSGIFNITADTGGDIFLNAENKLFRNAAGSTEHMRITSGGNVGIGTSSPNAKLDVEDTAGSLGSTKDDTAEFFRNDGTYGPRLQIRHSTTGTDIHHTYSTGASNLTFSNANAERMRIDSSGRLLINRTSASGVNPHSKLHVLADSAVSAATIQIGTNGYNGVSFLNASGSNVGSIVINASSTAYNTTSDYRLKEAVVDMTGAIDRVKALAPKRFNFIADPDTTVDGFLAHEAQTVVPEAITGTHNEVDDDGNAVMQGIDQSKLVPLLTGALREAITKIETLETQRADLEARLTALENAE